MLRLPVAALLILTACSGSPSTETVPPVEGTNEAGDTTTVALGEPSWRLTEIVFGSDGYLLITNEGPGAGDAGGLWIEARPNAMEIPATIVNPGQTLAVITGVGASPNSDHVVDGTVALGLFSPTGGEVGLHSRGIFSDPDALVDYVLWGAAAGVRTSVAEAAGLWPADAAIPVTSGTSGLVLIRVPSGGPDGWEPKASPGS